MQLPKASIHIKYEHPNTHTQELWCLARVAIVVVCRIKYNKFCVPKRVSEQKEIRKWGQALRGKGGCGAENWVKVQKMWFLFWLLGSPNFDRLGNFSINFQLPMRRCTHTHVCMYVCVCVCIKYIYIRDDNGEGSVMPSCIANDDGRRLSETRVCSTVHGTWHKVDDAELPGSQVALAIFQYSHKRLT